MTRAVLIVSCATVMAFGGGFISNMSFSYGGDSGKMDKNFVRDNEKEVVKDLKSGMIYYDAAPSSKMDYNKAVAYCNGSLQRYSPIYHLVIDMAAVGNEQRSAIEQSPGQRDSRIKNRQAEDDNRGHPPPDGLFGK